MQKVRTRTRIKIKREKKGGMSMCVCICLLKFSIGNRKYVYHFLAGWLAGCVSGLGVGGI